MDENGGIYLQGETQGILREKFEILKSSNVRVPWIIDIFNKFKIHREKVGNFENPSNFQNLLETLEKIDRKDLIDFRKILVDSEINPKHLEKYKMYEDIIEFEDLYIEKLKNKIEKSPIEKESYEEKSLILETKNLTFEYPNSGIKAIRNLSPAGCPFRSLSSLSPSQSSMIKW